MSIRYSRVGVKQDPHFLSRSLINLYKYTYFVSLLKSDHLSRNISSHRIADTDTIVANFRVICVYVTAGCPEEWRSEKMITDEVLSTCSFYALVFSTVTCYLILVSFLLFVLSR